MTPSSALGPIQTVNFPLSAVHLPSDVQKARSFEVITKMAVVLCPPERVILLNPFSYFRGREYDPKSSFTKSRATSSAVTLP